MAPHWDFAFGRTGRRSSSNVELAPLSRLAGEARDEAMHAPGHRADEAGDLGALALEPEIGQVMALQLPAEKRADAAARKPDASFLPRLCIEHEHVGQEVAQMGRIDVAARRRGALPAQPVPMIEEPSCRRQSQRLLLTRGHFRKARAVRAPKGASKCAPMAR